MDCGKVGDEQVCPPKLMIFDLSNDMLVKNVEIPEYIANNKSLLVTPIVQRPRCCEKLLDEAVVRYFLLDIMSCILIRIS